MQGSRFSYGKRTQKVEVRPPGVSIDALMSKCPVLYKCCGVPDLVPRGQELWAPPPRLRLVCPLCPLRTSGS